MYLFILSILKSQQLSQTAQESEELKQALIDKSKAG